MIRADASDLWNFLTQITSEMERPRFVKVGANDGVSGDPCGKFFLHNLHWTGLLIEPVPYLVEKLKWIYADRSRFMIEPVAVGSVPGETQFYYVSEEARRSHPDFPDWSDQLGSFNRQHILNHIQSLEPFIIAMTVTVEPLQSILQRHCLTEVEFLHIDTEGHDLQVLKSVNLRTLAPLAVWVEHKHLSPEEQWEMRELLESHSYDVREAEGDLFAVHREAQQMMHRSHPSGALSTYCT